MFGNKNRQTGGDTGNSAGDNADDHRVAGRGRRRNIAPIRTEQPKEKAAPGTDKKVSGDSDAAAGAESADKARGHEW